jgi:hypothetical protein
MSLINCRQFRDSGTILWTLRSALLAAFEVVQVLHHALISMPTWPFGIYVQRTLLRSTQGRIPNPALLDNKTVS